MSLIELPLPGLSLRSARHAKKQKKLPFLRCQSLLDSLPEPLFLPDDWNSIARSFSQMDRCSLGQHWRSSPEAGFQPATVSAAWQEDSLWIYAELSDEDIFNAADGVNQRTWEMGDVFEIFLRPSSGEGSAETYFEFHITPENQLLQLRWPNASAAENVRDDSQFQSFLLQPRVIRSYTHINREQNKWRVLVSLSWNVLERRPVVGEKWAFSFSRYDVSQGNGKAILSSSSPHPVPRFHRQQEWGTLQFAE